MTYLPDDIWHEICTQLRDQRSLNSLFNCACSGKQLAPIALANLYRVHHVALASNSYSSEEIRLPDGFGITTPKLVHVKWIVKRSLPRHERYVKKWAGLWRTITLSSLGKTLYPYTQYIRTLNLRDLENILSDPWFVNRYYRTFFQGELAQFQFYERRASRIFHRFDTVEIVNSMGEAITKQTPLLKELTGKVRCGELSRWISRLPRLTNLRPYDGVAVEGNGNAVRIHCPSLKGLHIRHWDDTNTDQALAAFLNELRPQSLESFEMASYNNVGPQSFHALDCHGASLITLKLDRLPLGAISKVSLLKSCTNLVSLSLGGRKVDYMDLENEDNNAVLEMAAWLWACKQLRNLAFTHFPSAEALIESILLETDIHLTSLEYEGPGFPDNRILLALGNHTSLRFLYLKEDEDLGYFNPEADDFLVESLSKLINLTHLNVCNKAKHLSDLHIMRLASSLPKLEAWSTNGDLLTDAIWGAVASLRSLRSLYFGAMTDFTVDGTLDFIENLGPGNKGLLLYVTNWGSVLSWTEQNLIQKKISSKVGGNFGLSHDEDFSTFEYESEYHPD